MVVGDFVLYIVVLLQFYVCEAKYIFKPHKPHINVHTDSC